jgi:hypothetical protein
MTVWRAYRFALGPLQMHPSGAYGLRPTRIELLSDLYLYV